MKEQWKAFDSIRERGEYCVSFVCGGSCVVFCILAWLKSGLANRATIPSFKVDDEINTITAMNWKCEEKKKNGKNVDIELPVKWMDVSNMPFHYRVAV